MSFERRVFPPMRLCPGLVVQKNPSTDEAPSFVPNCRMLLASASFLDRNYAHDRWSAVNLVFSVLLPSVSHHYNTVQWPDDHNGLDSHQLVLGKGRNWRTETIPLATGLCVKVNLLCLVALASYQDLKTDLVVESIKPERLMVVDRFMSQRNTAPGRFYNSAYWPAEEEEISATT